MKKYLKEFFTYPDIAFMIILFFCLLVPIMYSFRWLMILLFIGGMISFAANEYLTHRFLFHMKPSNKKWLYNLIKRLHYDHHKNPNNLQLLFLPLWYTLPLFGTAFLIIYLITNHLIYTLTWIAGAIAALLYYEWKHYAAHRPIVPLTRWGKWMKKYHLWHHFKNENYWYGVSNPVGDFLLGTYKDQQQVDKSSTVKSLHEKKDVRRHENDMKS